CPFRYRLTLSPIVLLPILLECLLIEVPSHFVFIHWHPVSLPALLLQITQRHVLDDPRTVRAQTGVSPKGSIRPHYTINRFIDDLLLDLRRPRHVCEAPHNRSHLWHQSLIQYRFHFLDFNGL